MSEEDFDVDNSPAKPKGKSKAAVLDSDDENVPVAGGSKKKDASEMYQKVCLSFPRSTLKVDLQLSQLEHVLKRPDSYIGSVEAITQMMWVYDEATKMMVNR